MVSRKPTVDKQNQTEEKSDNFRFDQDSKGFETFLIFLEKIFSFFRKKDSKKQEPEESVTNPVELDINTDKQISNSLHAILEQDLEVVQQNMRVAKLMLDLSYNKFNFKKFENLAQKVKEVHPDLFPDVSEKFMSRLVLIESSGQNISGKAAGDNSKDFSSSDSFGYTQVTFSEAVKIQKNGDPLGYGEITVEKLQNPEINMAYGMYIAQTMYYAAENKGIETSEVNIARMYNGGTKGYEMSATEYHGDKYRAAKLAFPDLASKNNMISSNTVSASFQRS